MNKTQLIKALNNQIEGETIKSLTLIIDTVIEIITAELKANNRVSFQSFLTIENHLVTLEWKPKELQYLAPQITNYQ